MNQENRRVSDALHYNLDPFRALVGLRTDQAEKSIATLEASLDSTTMLLGYALARDARGEIELDAAIRRTAICRLLRIRAYRALYPEGSTYPRTTRQVSEYLATVPGEETAAPHCSVLPRPLRNLGGR